MFCSNCGKKLNDHCLFCPDCGASIDQQADDSDMTNIQNSESSSLCEDFYLEWNNENSFFLSRRKRKTAVLIYRDKIEIYNVNPLIDLEAWGRRLASDDTGDTPFDQEVFKDEIDENSVTVLFKNQIMSAKLGRKFFFMPLVCCVLFCIVGCLGYVFSFLLAAMCLFLGIKRCIIIKTGNGKKIKLCYKPLSEESAKEILSKI